MTAITYDPAFPQIAVVLEPQRMRSILQLLLFRSTDPNKPKLIVEKCSIGEKRHKPGNSFVLSYHLDIVNSQTGMRFKQRLTGKLYRLGLASAEYERWRNQNTTSTSDVPAVSHLPGLGMIIWAFPHDRKLLHLHRFFNIEWLKKYFSTKSAVLGFTDPDQMAAIAMEVLHYIPERSCMIRYRISLSKDHDEARQFVIYGKHFRDEIGGAAYETMHQVAGQNPRSAKPLYYDSAARVLWQSHVQGQLFSWERQDRVQHPALMNKIADCVAGFHLCSLNNRDGWGHADIEKQLLETRQIATGCNMRLAGQIRRHVADLSSHRDGLDWSLARKTPLHMDLKTQNFLIDGIGAVLIDLDCVAIGDHLIDIGSLMANFYLNGLNSGFSVAEVDALVEQFVQRYALSIPWPIDHARLNWYTAAAFVHEVLRRGILQRDEKRLLHVKSYLELSKRYLLLSKTGC